jgi:hypothetical protein
LDLRQRFGRRITELVLAVSDDERITGYAKRKAALRQQVARAGDEALTLFAADKLSKLRELRRETDIDPDGEPATGGVGELSARRLRHYQRRSRCSRNASPNRRSCESCATSSPRSVAPPRRSLARAEQRLGIEPSAALVSALGRPASHSKRSLSASTSSLSRRAMALAASRHCGWVMSCARIVRPSVRGGCGDLELCSRSRFPIRSGRAG